MNEGRPDCEACGGRGWLMTKTSERGPISTLKRTDCKACEAPKENEMKTATPKTSLKNPGRKKAAKRKAKKAAPKKRAKKAAKKKAKPSTRTIKRVYKGETLTLKLAADGTCKLDGVTYPSLTAAAKYVCNAKSISGPAFWGTNK